MKKLGQNTKEYILKADQYWQSLPRSRQRLLTIVFFITYVLVALFNTLHLWTIDHPINQGFPKDHIKGIQSEIKENATITNPNKNEKNE